MTNERDLNALEKAAERAARLGGEQLLNWADKFQVQEKNPGDFVTQADFASQKVIREYLQAEFPEHNFLGEEDDAPHTGWQPGKFCWIVDPLDGTRNYIHQLNSYSVSVGLVYTDLDGNDELIAGAVFDPVVDECFTAAQGQGAKLNGTPIQTSRRSSLRDAMLVCSFPPRVKSNSVEIARFVNLLTRSGCLRRLGSAALNLCYVACGRIDAYWATSVNAWDITAGAMILNEANGGISQLDGSAIRLRNPKFVAYASEELRDEMLPWLQSEEIVEVA